MDLKKIRYEVLDWNRVVQYSVQCRALVNAVSAI
jgi:hypothetical protein